MIKAIKFVGVPVADQQRALNRVAGDDRGIGALADPDAEPRQPQNARTTGVALRRAGEAPRGRARECSGQPSLLGRRRHGILLAQASLMGAQVLPLFEPLLLHRTCRPGRVSPGSAPC